MTGIAPANCVYAFGPFQFETATRRLTNEGRVARLPPKAADVLALLLERAGDVVTRDELSVVWDGTTVVRAAQDYQIYLVRQALKKGMTGPTIEVVPQRGFRFVVPVLRSPQSSLESSRAGAPTALAPVGRRHPLKWALALLVVAFVVIVVVPQLVPASSFVVERYEQLTNTPGRKLQRPLMTDDAYVYYASNTTTEIARVPVGGGTTAPAFPGAGAFIPEQISPDRSEYLALFSPTTDDRGRELWRLPITPGAPQRVGALRCQAASWSSDGARIACAEEEVISISDRDGGAVTRIRFDKGSTTWPRWSPDGRRIRLTLVAPDEIGLSATTLWEIDVATGRRRRLLADDTRFRNVCCGSWTPDGKAFVFEATDAGQTQLWYLPERESWFGRRPRAVQLTSSTLSFHSPIVSMNGRTVFALGQPPGGEIVRYDTRLRQFALYLRQVSGTWVSYSPDQRSVAYVGYPDRRLWRTTIDGASRQLLTHGPFEVDGASWSPDGRWIAFLSRMRGQQLRIFLIPAAGGEAVPIVEHDQKQGIPSWSPDGRQIVFGDVPKQYGRRDGSERLHLYDLESRAITDIPGSEGLWTPRWSPNGRYLSAHGIEEGRLRLLDLRTMKWRDLPADRVDNATWSRAGTHIYYTTAGDSFWLHRMRVADGRVESLLNLTESPLIAYWWTGLAPDDSPIMLRSLGMPQIYALRLGRR